MEQYYIVNTSARDVSNFIDLHNEFLKKFPDEFKDKRNIPRLMEIRATQEDGEVVRWTYRYNPGSNLFDVHAEIENNVLALPHKLSPEFEHIRDGGTFDLQARVTRNGEKLSVYLAKPAKDVARNAWLLAKIGKTGLTNLGNIMNMFFICAKSVYYLPFAMKFSYSANGKAYASFPANFKELAREGIQKLIIAEKEKHRFDGWDVVRLTWEEFFRVRSIAYDTGFIDDMDCIPLKRFAVVIQSDGKKGYVARYTATSNRLSYIVELTDDVLNDIRGEFEVERSVNPLTHEARLNYRLISKIREDSPLLDKYRDTEMTTLDAIFQVFLAINSFILNYRDETMDVEERVCEKPSEQKHGKHSHRSAVRLFKTYTLKKGWKTKANRKKAEIHCLAWGVRGHWRHYKSGKVVFIAPFVKGKERAKYAGKDYVLLPKE